jgi:glutathione S-transferase
VPRRDPCGNCAALPGSTGRAHHGTLPLLEVPVHRLITIPISHYCEKARWALDRTGEPYHEDGHLQLLHWRVSLGAGGGRTVPVLVTDEGKILPDSTDILQWLHARHPSAGLYGIDDAQRQEIEALEDEFDRRLGPASRRWAYFHLLPHREMTVRLSSQHVPPGEVRVLKAIFPLVRQMLIRGLKIDAAGERKSLAKMREAFAQVSERLADGRRYLVGDRLSAADITFASLGYLAVLPEGHPLHLPSLTELPLVMRSVVEELRETPAGRHVQRLYSEERAIVVTHKAAA